MSITKPHSLFRIIHAMDSTEKAYFKKYAFKRDNKNNSSYIAIFDIVDKQEEFNLDKIRTSRALAKSHKTNIHAALNSLYNLVIQTLLDYRKDKSNTNHLLQLHEEYYLYKDKGLNDLAEKKMNQMEDWVNEKRMYFFKPYIIHFKGSLLRNNIVADTNLLNNYIDKMNRSKEEIGMTIDIGVFALQLESLFHRNGGIVHKNEDSLQEVDSLLKKVGELIEMAGNNFLFYSVNVGNRFVIQMISGKMENMENQILDYLDFFDKSISQELSDNELGDIVITLKNFAVVTLYLGEIDIYEQVHKRIIRTQEKYNKQEAKERLQIRIAHLRMANYAINNVDPPSKEEFTECIRIMNKLEKSKSQYPELLLSIMMCLVRQKQFDQAIEISNEFVNSQHNERIRDAYLSIRLVRAIIWFKKDEYDVFLSEIQSVHRKIKGSENFPFQLHISQMLKKLNKLTVSQDNEKIIKQIVNECNEVLKTGTGSERIKAMEIKAIAELPFT